MVVWKKNFTSQLLGSKMRKSTFLKKNAFGLKFFANYGAGDYEMVYPPTNHRTFEILRTAVVLRRF